MHCMMNITRKLLDLLVQAAIHNDSVSKQWETILQEKCKLKLAEGRDPKTGKVRTLAQKLDMASPTRSQYLAILKHHELLLELLDVLLSDNLERAVSIRQLWSQFSTLMAIMMQADVPMPEAIWLMKAHEWGSLYTSIYSSSHVTPYIHLFVYHMGYYQEQYRGIEKFAQYALEGKHFTNKKILVYSSNKFLHGELSTLKQQMQAQLRLEVHNQCDQDNPANLKTSQPSSRKERRRKNPAWSAQALSKCDEELRPYVLSATHIS